MFCLTLEPGMMRHNQFTVAEAEKMHKRKLVNFDSHFGLTAVAWFEQQQEKSWRIYVGKEMKAKCITRQETVGWKMPGIDADGWWLMENIWSKIISMQMLYEFVDTARRNFHLFK